MLKVQDLKSPGFFIIKLYDEEDNFIVSRARVWFNGDDIPVIAEPFSINGNGEISHWYNREKDFTIDDIIEGSF